MIPRLDHIELLIQANANDGPGSNHIYLLIGGMLLITLWLLMRLRKHHKRRELAPGPHERLERMRQMRGMRGDLEDLMVEIEQLAKRMGAQLDAKAIQLERLLDDAEQKIAHLQSLNGDLGPSANGQRHQVHADGANSTGPNLPDDVSPQPPDDPLARSIYELADQGVEPNDIAHKLDEHVGKVELILALRRA